MSVAPCLRAAGLAVMVSACAAPITTHTSVTYLAPEPASVERVAILPVSSGEGLEGFRRMISDSLYATLRRGQPAIMILPADSTLARLNAAGLTERYARLIRDYQQTSILDRAVLDSIARATGTRHLLYTRAAYETGRSVTGNFLTGYSARRDQDLQLFVHIWDGGKGDVVWEAVATGKVSAGELEYSRGVDEILAASVQDLVAKFLAAPVGRAARR
jgi:hypothetical protein